jgi:hypothetical protein
MSCEDNKKPTLLEPSAEPHGEVPRSGVGAGTALFAMLRRRRMRASQDAEPDLPPPGAPAQNNSGE